MPAELPDDQRRLRALSHPVRLRILSLLVDSPKSGTALAKDLGTTQAAVSYHLRSLDKAKLIELDSTRSVRGGLEKLYRLAPGGDAHGSPASMASSAAAVTAEVMRRVRASKARSWDVFGDADIWVPEKTWIRISNAVVDLMEELHDEATAPKATGAVHVSATTLMFRAPVRKARSARSSASPKKATVKPTHKRR